MNYKSELCHKWHLCFIVMEIKIQTDTDGQIDC